MVALEGLRGLVFIAEVPLQLELLSVLRFLTDRDPFPAFYF
jgi:hypothetical protein